MDSQAEEWKEKMKKLLVGINRYNPEIIGSLEEYVTFQSKHGYYDFEANLALLKLYQFRPSTVNREMAIKLLLKSLMQLPSTDFVILRCVLPQTLHNDATIQFICDLYTQLGCCQFKSFWLSLQDCTDELDGVHLFREAIRNYICHVVDISYQNIPYPLLHDYLGEVESSVITDLIAKHGWQVKSEKGVGQGEGAEQEEEHKVVLIKNQEATIRPKKILAKIEFDSVAGLLSMAAAR